MVTGRSNEPTVASLMTGNPVVVMEDDAIAGVAELLAGYEITGLPVVVRQIGWSVSSVRPTWSGSGDRTSPGPDGTDSWSATS